MNRAPHPDETRYNPYNKRALQQLQPSQARRTLLAVSDSIRSTEAVLERELTKIGKSTGNDPRNVNINVNQHRMQNPATGMIAKRARTQQQNLETHYQNWADACKRHYNETEQEVAPNN